MIWALVSLVCLGQALVTWGLSDRNSVDVPKWDHWPTVGTPLLKWLEGGLTYADLHEQVVDNRMPVTRLVHLAIALSTGWRTQAETAATVFCLLSSCALIGYVAWRQDRGIEGFGPLIPGIAGLALLSPVSSIVWTYAPLLLVGLLILECCLLLAIDASPLGEVAKFIAGAVITLAGSFTFLSGWLLWGIWIWHLYDGGRWRGLGRRQRWYRLVIAAGLFAISLVAYFRGYQFHGDPGVMKRLISAPGDYGLFFLRWMGSPLSYPWAGMEREHREAFLEFWSGWVGGLGVFCGLVLAVRGMVSESGARRTAAPWTGLLAFAWGCGAIITLGRFHLSSQAAFWPRYHPFALLGWVSLAALAVRQWPGFPRPVKIVAVLSAAGLASGLTTGFAEGIHMMRGDYFGSQLTRAAMIMSGSAPEPLLIRSLYPGHSGESLEEGRRLHELGYLRPGFIDEPLVRMAVSGKPSDEGGRFLEGEILEATVDAVGRLGARGWAFDDFNGGPADAVVLSVQREGEEESWHRIAAHRLYLKKPAKLHGFTGKDVRLGWECRPEDVVTGAPGEKLPFLRQLAPGRYVVRAYAMVTEGPEFYQLSGEKFITVKPVAGP